LIIVTFLSGRFLLCIYEVIKSVLLVLLKYKNKKKLIFCVKCVVSDLGTGKQGSNPQKLDLDPTPTRPLYHSDQEAKTVELYYE
jgi:hypothetical protein